MLVVPPSGQNWNQWSVQFEFSSGAIWWVDLELMLVVSSGQNWNQWSVLLEFSFLVNLPALYLAGEIIQVIEAIPGSVVPLAMSTCFCRAGRGISAEYFMSQSSMLSMKIVLYMHLPHRKQNCRWTTAEVPLLGQIIFSKIVTQCFDKSFKLDPCCLAPHNDRLLPSDYQAQQHNWDLMHVGKMC
jgi:hypothetical protein